MTEEEGLVSNEDRQRHALALLDKSLKLLDQLELSTPAARLSMVIEEVRDAKFD